MSNRGPPFRSCLLSLCFNHEEFCDGLYVQRKTFAFTVFAGSGALLEGRIALGPPRSPSFGPSRRSPTRFWRLCGCAEFRQKSQNGATDPDRCQVAGSVTTLPRQPPVRDARARQAQLRVGGQDYPSPPVGLLRMPHPWGRPSQSLLEEADRVLQIESANVGPPQKVEVRRSSARTMPPQP